MTARQGEVSTGGRSEGGPGIGGMAHREGVDVPADRATEDDAPETTRDDQPGAGSAATTREEAETPDALERGGPAGTLPVGPAVDGVRQSGPPVPGAGEPRRAEPGTGRGGGREEAAPDDRGGPHEERRPLTTWTGDEEDDEPGEAPGVAMPPG